MHCFQLCTKVSPAKSFYRPVYKWGVQISNSRQGHSCLLRPFHIGFGITLPGPSHWNNIPRGLTRCYMPMTTHLLGASNSLRHMKVKYIRRIFFPNYLYNMKNYSCSRVVLIYQNQNVSSISKMVFAWSGASMAYTFKRPEHELSEVIEGTAEQARVTTNRSGLYDHQFRDEKETCCGQKSLSLRPAVLTFPGERIIRAHINFWSSESKERPGM